MLARKQCCCCGRNKPATLRYFYLHDGHFRGKCRRCMARQKKARRKNDPSWKDAENKASLAAYYKYRDRYRAAQNESYSQSEDLRKAAVIRAAEWAVANPLRAKALRQNLYARNRGADEELTAEMVAFIELRDGGKCRYCEVVVVQGMGPTGKSFDHEVPLSRGGPHRVENIVIACRSCNGRKGDMLPDEYRRYLNQRIGKRRRKWDKESPASAM